MELLAVWSLWTLENLLEDAIFIPYSDSEQTIPSPPNQFWISNYTY